MSFFVETKEMRPVFAHLLVPAMLLAASHTYSQEKNTTNMITTTQKETIMTVSHASPGKVCFIDKFVVPAAAIGEFDERVRINRTFIRTLPGFIEDAMYTHTDEQGNLICVTVAQWASQAAVDKAREAVQAEYKRQGFDMPAMLKRLNITIDRGLYTQSPEGAH